MDKSKPKKEDDSASKNVSFFFGMRYVGALITAYLSGEFI